MDVQINDTDAAISTCDQIINLVTNDLSSYLDTSSGIGNLDSIWETTGTDKETYQSKFRANNENLQTIAENIKTLANAVKDYAQELKTTSQKKSN